ncbi:MAG: carboxyl-terminal protease [Dehalococcoidia bacterium]|nr:carboxyl-terminal protease [Dehalococcoidia bacterium]
MRRLAFALALAALLFIIPLQGCLPTTSGATGGLESVSEVWDYLGREYVEPAKLNPQEMSRAAIEGMLGKLNDPWTYYLDSSTFQLHQRSLEGLYYGIGARVSLDEGNLTIVTVFPDSPADKAGLKAGDSIRAVNGEPVSGMANVQEAVLKVQGPRGSTVKLLVLRVGQTQPQEMSLVRAEIKVPSATLAKRGDIALVSLLQFTDRSDQEMSLVLSEALNTGSRALILDLRDNPGGPLETVVNTTSLFLKKGQIVLTVADRAGGRSDRKASDDGLASMIPMVVLVNQHSASGSEVLAGALQDHKRATVAGAKTTGKGSVNRIVPLKDGSAISITVARWLTPSGRAIEGNGLVPDVASELQGEELVSWAIEYLKSSK